MNDHNSTLNEKGRGMSAPPGQKVTPSEKLTLPACTISMSKSSRVDDV